MYTPDNIPFPDMSYVLKSEVEGVRKGLELAKKAVEKRVNSYSCLALTVAAGKDLYGINVSREEVGFTKKFIHRCLGDSANTLEIYVAKKSGDIGMLSFINPWKTQEYRLRWLQRMLDELDRFVFPDFPKVELHNHQKTPYVMLRVSQELPEAPKDPGDQMVCLAVGRVCEEVDLGEGLSWKIQDSIQRGLAPSVSVEGYWRKSVGQGTTRPPPKVFCQYRKDWIDSMLQNLQ